MLEEVLLSKSMTGIIHLDLSQNQIEDSWLESFKMIVNRQEKRTLEVLELAGNRLGVYTGTQLPFFLQPRKLPLKLLTLDRNELGD